MKKYRHRNRNRKQNKILLFSSIGILLIMTAGYAAFETQLNINAKGNIKEYNASFQLTRNVVTSGDGLYVDVLESDRYIYRGQNPNNFILFNNELWRIVAVENDETLKIIRRESLGSMSWDSANNRNNDNNTFCNRETTYDGTTQYWGCNVWAAVTGEYTNGVYTGTVTTDASLNTYLNTEYYNSLNDDKNYIVNHVFNIGSPSGYDTLIAGIYEVEKERTWSGSIGLVNISDFLKASTDEKCTSITNSRDEATPCSLENGNYLDEVKLETWTINCYSQSAEYLNSSGVRTISAFGTGAISGWYSSYLYQVRPVVFLNSNIKLTGKGTESDPYIIE